MVRQVAGRAAGELGRRPTHDWWARHQQRVIPYVFLTPNLVVFAIFMFVPIILAFYASLTEWSTIGTPSFVGMDNYAEMARDERFWQSLSNTVIYTVGVVPPSIVIGLALAIGLNRKLPGRTFIRSVFFLPVIIPLIAVALLAIWLFDPHYGVFNAFLAAVGLGRVPWLSSETWAMPSLVLTTLWIRIGFCMVLYLAALQSIPVELYQAARVDGAGGWKQFRHVTWPLLAPATFLLLIINVIYSLHVFELIYVMTGGGPGFSTTVLVQYIYQLAFETGEMGYASAVGITLYLLLMAFTVLLWRYTRRRGNA